MDFTLTPAHEALRHTIRRIIAATVTDEVIEQANASGTSLCKPLAMALAREGILERAAPGIGRGDPVEMWLLSSEVDRAGVPLDGT
ncbi:MAG TPA: hypothetical protein VGM78_08775, partial [Ilumatobacteraceae bacterium]